MGARFVRLGIAGFKSFADSTSIEILPGLTGVVGPNGCGKSNVAEALRWVMGEANARHLRGGEMDDVIFAGTSNRPSRNLAEVSLHVEDGDGGLPPPFAAHTELQIVRRIERGLGSAYRVNGLESRARDVQTLFADLASGARSSAMVSQGRVGLLVNARPEERRAVLEEAAGITGLHARRHEAETRLRAAETNLERAEERRSLLERQLEGLQAQARQAALYRTVVTALLEAEASLLAMQRARAVALVGHATAAKEAAEQAIQRAVAAAHAAGLSSSLAQAAVPALREAESEARSRLDRARLTQETAAAEAARAETALSSAVQRQAQLARDLTHARGLLGDAEGADTRLAAEAERLAVEAAEFPSVHEAAALEADAAAAALQNADQTAAATAAVAAEAAAKAGASRQALSQAQTRFGRAEQALSRLTADRARVAAGMVDAQQLDAVAAALSSAEHALSLARQDQDQADAARAKAMSHAAQTRDIHTRQDMIRHKLAAEVSALAEVLAVKDGERWPPMVDRLSVPPGLEAALGAVLGEELAAAEDPGAPRHWRVLPPLAARTLPGKALADVVDGPSLLDRTLSGIGLVDGDPEGYAAQAALLPGQSLVSPAGAVWRWDGYTIRAGTPTAAAVRLRQRNHLSALRERLAEAERLTSEARHVRQEADRAEQATGQVEQQAKIARRVAEGNVERAMATARALRAQAEVGAMRMANLDEQAAQLAPELEAARVELGAAQLESTALADPVALRAAADLARGAVMAARARELAATRALDTLHRAEQSRRARLGSIGREREDRRMRAADLVGRVADLEARSEEAAAEYERLIDAPGQLAEQASQAHAAVAGALAAMQVAVAMREAGETAATLAGTTARDAEHAVYSAREALIRAEAEFDAASTGLEATAARIAEREGALPPLPFPADVSAAAEERGRSRLNRLVRERDGMGPVNLRAELEAGTIEGEIATIVHERDELGTAIAKLRGSIGHLNREGRERLSAMFQQIDRHFQALFGRMFGGGRAHLALVGSDDPLQAGLEIYAQPPGKKLTALSLLSGGEQALTALSLIFAVFRCNPAPLCVLDEVDAPLDDANVDRFCALLQDMVRETATRFLVVTHHQLTMSRMDRLYGVTMQERGVSRLLSVDLTRAVGMIEAVAAE